MSADNFKKTLDLDGSAPEPAIQSSDTGLLVGCLGFALVLLNLFTIRNRF